MWRQFQMVFCVVLLGLAGCVPATSMPERAASTVELPKSPSVSPSMEPTTSGLALSPSATSSATPTALPFTATPIPPTEPPKPTIDIKPGESLIFGSLEMRDSLNGWAARRRDCEGGSFCLGYPAYGEVWRTQDGGQTWQASQPFDLGEPVEFFQPRRLQFIDSSTGWLLVSVARGLGEDKYRIFQTNDGGESWMLVSDNYSGPSLCYSAGLAFADAQHGWLGNNCLLASMGRLGVYQTQDGGHNWKWLDLPIPAEAPSGFTLDEWCGVESMSPIAPGAVRLEIACDLYTPDLNRVYFYYVTIDAGQSWQSGLGSGSAYFLNASVGWRLINTTGQTGLLQQTVNAGQTWQTLKTVAWQEAQFDFVSEQVGWAIAGDGKVAALLHTQNGGQTWDEIKPVSAP